MRKLQLAIALAALAAQLLVLDVLPAAPQPAAGGVAGVGSGHSGWRWSTPVPQGNDLDALDLEGPRGYAAGAFGTLLRTDDGGSRWTALAPGLTEDIARVRAIGPDSVVVAADCALRRSDDSGRTFHRLPWTTHEGRCPSPVVGLSFPSAEVGYLLLDNGRLYRSADAGATWRRMTDVPLGVGADVVATDAVFQTLDDGVVTTTVGIYRTTDGGASWARVAEQAGGFASVQFAGPLVGYAVGDGVVYRTADGGAVWSATATPPGAPALAAIDCAGANACIAAAADGAKLERTLDGGKSWTVVALGGGVTRAVAFASTDRAVAVGAAGAISLSADAGSTWSSVAASLGGSFTNLCGSSRAGATAFAIGRRGALARTIDGGLTWTRLAAPSSEDLVDVSFGDRSTGLALDAAGGVFRTADAGASWRAVQIGAAAVPQALLALDEEHVLLIGPRGIRRSSDGAASFRPVRRRAVSGALLFGADYAGGWVFAYGPRALFASRDGGRSWRKLRRPENRPLGLVDFVGSRVGFALEKGGRVWRTGDRGHHWSELRATGTDGSTDLAFITPREGYVVAHDLFYAQGSGRPDYVLRTTDGGASWRPQLVADSTHFNGVLANPGQAGLLLAGDHQIFRTTTGGDWGSASSLRLRRRRVLDRPGRVSISGVLRPAHGGEQVVVSKATANPRRRRGGIDWGFRAVRVRADGSFSTSWPIRRSSAFVAQWSGDGNRRSAGSRVLVVHVRGR